MAMSLFPQKSCRRRADTQATSLSCLSTTMSSRSAGSTQTQHEDHEDWVHRHRWGARQEKRKATTTRSFEQCSTSVSAQRLAVRIPSRAVQAHPEHRAQHDERNLWNMLAMRSPHQLCTNGKPAIDFPCRSHPTVAQIMVSVSAAPRHAQELLHWLARQHSSKL